MLRISVCVWPEQKKWLDREIGRDRFSSYSHAYRDLIRLDQQNRRELTRLRRELYKAGGG